MKRIIIHWTAGTNFPNSIDLTHYHFVVDKNGKVIEGKYKPSDNLNCYDGRYAAHTGGGNTGSIGIAACGMLGYNDPKHVGQFPLFEVQMEALFKKCAELCKQYTIVISPATVLTHYEFGKQNPKTDSARKPDISFLPYKPELKSEEIGNYIRGKVKWYYERV